MGFPRCSVRSHLKLDTLGLESGRLGSLVLHEPVDCADASRPAAEGLRHLIPDVIRSFGLGPQPGSFFPVLSTAQLIELSRLRAMRTAENCELLASLLDEALPPQIYIRRYQHGQFLTLHQSDWLEAAPVKRLAKQIVAFHRSRCGCIATANSFGFDFTVLSDVMDMTSNKFTLRVAPSDEPAEMMLILAESIATIALAGRINKSTAKK